MGPLLRSKRLATPIKARYVEHTDGKNGTASNNNVDFVAPYQEKKRGGWGDLLSEETPTSHRRTHSPRVLLLGLGLGGETDGLVGLHAGCGRWDKLGCLGCSLALPGLVASRKVPKTTQIYFALPELLSLQIGTGTTEHQTLRGNNGA
eukprot:9357989-Prorocentrum_lima.AAC.1